MKKIAILTIGIALTLIAIPTIMAKGAEENIPTNAKENTGFLEEEKGPAQMPEHAQNKAQKGQRNAEREMAQNNEKPDVGKENAPGLQMKENKGKPEKANQGKGFGDYVSRIAKSHIPDAMNELDLNFGEKFVKPFTPATEQDPKTSSVETEDTSTQEWVVGPNDEYAAQTYTWKSEDDPWREQGHDYVVIWSQNQINDIENTTQYEFSSEDSYPLDGNFTGYYFDVTDME